jgi:hypothetical protein
MRERVRKDDAPHDRGRHPGFPVDILAIMRDFLYMATRQNIHPPDEGSITRNLGSWADITRLCIDLRKSVIRDRDGVEDDEELVRRVFRESVLAKEKKWTATDS